MNRRSFTKSKTRAGWKYELSDFQRHTQVTIETKESLDEAELLWWRDEQNDDGSDLKEKYENDE